MKRTGEWINLFDEIPSDVNVHAGGASFSLHKFPLVSKSGYIRKMVAKSGDVHLSEIKIPDIPGGAEAFELAAKFCYGINFGIGIENIAVLRCVAEYLEMTENYAVGNLVSRTEAYLNEVALQSLTGSITVLHQSENFLPLAEEIKMVSRCIDTIAFIICKESQFSIYLESDGGNEGALSSTMSQAKLAIDGWAEDLSVLRIDIFRRVLTAMMARGFKRYALGPVLMIYAQKSLRGLEIYGEERKQIEPREEHEKRVVLETIVGLLPKERNALSVSFLSMLLRAATYLQTAVACRLALEKRMGLQLGQAVLDDILIPSYSFTGDTLYDVDTVQRIVMNYLEYEVDRKQLSSTACDGHVSPPPSDMERVGKLMESYLAEIASYHNLPVLKFNALAEIIPAQSRVTEDGIYRAIDIYLKAHPALSDMERKTICSLMDCQKLSREAGAHAAQNDRLPVQTVVQVLYYEQQRLRDVMNDNLTGEASHALPTKMNIYSPDIRPVSDHVSSLKRENEDLKIELAKMKLEMKTKMKMKEIQRSGAASVLNSPSADKLPLPRKSFITSLSKKLGRLYTFARGDGITSSKNPKKPNKIRRHSIS